MLPCMKNPTFRPDDPVQQELYKRLRDSPVESACNWTIGDFEATVELVSVYVG